MGQKNDFHAFGYNSAKSEPIWMKFGTSVSQMLRLALADFGCDLLSSDSLRGSRILFFSDVNHVRFQRFPVRKILRHFYTTTSVGEALKTL